MEFSETSSQVLPSNYIIPCVRLGSVLLPTGIRTEPIVSLAR